MFKQSIKSFFILCLLFISTLSFSNTPPTVDDFDLQKAQNIVKNIQSALGKKNKSTKSITESINILEGLIAEANECASEQKNKIKALNNKISKDFEKDAKPTNAVDLKYLEQKKNDLLKDASACGLFSIKTKELLAQYKETLLLLKKEITFKKGYTLPTRLYYLPTHIKELSLPQGGSQTLADVFKIRMLLIVITLLFIANLIVYYSRILVKKKWRKNIPSLCLNVILIFLTLNFSLFYFVSPPFFKLTKFNELVGHICLLSVYLFGTLFLVQLFFSLRRLPKLDKQLNLRPGYIRLYVTLGILIYFLQRIGLAILMLWQASTEITALFQDLVFFIAIALLFSVLLTCIRKNKRLIERVLKVAFLYQVLFTGTFLLIMFDFLGYNVLAINISHVIFTLFFVSVLGLIAFHTIDKLYQTLNYSPYYQGLIRQQFGYMNPPPFLELLLLKMAAKGILILSLLYIFSYFIGTTSYLIEHILSFFYEGIHIAGLNLIPVYWLAAILMFSFLSLLTRKIATLTSQKYQEANADSDTQVAFSSITLYIGIIISIILSLLVAGFNFTSLTIIAGALSVGIGLGLQSVVNNFVSGLILLIEKPVKVGDRIQIDNIEGFVKNIRVRSTQILTPAKEDIMIPNADFINHQVKNYMYRDKSWRIKCAVGVDYGSDVDLVTEVLKEVALSHPEILKRAPNEPSVFFRAFGDSALLFELWCLIKDVNKKYKINSDLNYAIIKAFRKNNISIAFPQQDVHLKIDKENKERLKTTTSC